ncbi:hypothetical protein [Pasteurella sp. PK-2025]|uniref:hypothetical protein n=1 Tax=Pasteurella sp. PK-2025 TaxID=3413133 RepID=UPI003C796DB2
MSKLEEFGKVYIDDVRDRTILLLENILKGQVNAPRFKDLQENLNQLGVEEIELIKYITISLIDNTLHNTLCLFEEYPEYELISDGENIIDLSDGLSAELYTDDGWIKKYSKYPSSFK